MESEANGIWRTFFVRVAIVLLSVLGFIMLAFATWNQSEHASIEDELKVKLDKEQYYRDISQIDRKLETIQTLVQEVHTRKVVETK